MMAELPDATSPSPDDGRAPSPGTDVLLQVKGLTKSFQAGRQRVVEVFREVSFSIVTGEMVAIVGESGAGKSSLLHLLAGLERPDGGEVWLAGNRIDRLQGRDAACHRNRDVGFVWQFHYLLPEFSARENVAMPLLARGGPRKAALATADAMLAEVGLADRGAHRSGELSGGEQQRVSIARALVGKPRLLLADEPTGDLDGRTADGMMDLLQRLHAAHGLTSVLVTHNAGIAHRCDRTFRLSGASLQQERR